MISLKVFWCPIRSCSWLSKSLITLDDLATRCLGARYTHLALHFFQYLDVRIQRLLSPEQPPSNFLQALTIREGKAIIRHRGSADA